MVIFSLIKLRSCHKIKKKKLSEVKVIRVIIFVPVYQVLLVQLCFVLSICVIYLTEDDSCLAVNLAN